MATYLCGHFIKKYQNPLGFCFLVQIRATASVI